MGSELILNEFKNVLDQTHRDSYEREEGTYPFSSAMVLNKAMVQSIHALSIANDIWGKEEKVKLPKLVDPRNKKMNTKINSDDSILSEVLTKSTSKQLIYFTKLPKTLEMMEKMVLNRGEKYVIPPLEINEDKPIQP